MTKAEKQDWFIFFYSVPSHPVSSRMKVWRKLVKAGAAQLKGGVYILPATEEHKEFLQWLIGEVKSMGGDGAFVRSKGIETMDDADIRNIFIGQSEKEYRGPDKTLAGLEQKVQSFRKGTKIQDRALLVDRLTKMLKEYDDIRKRDFFSSERGTSVRKRMQALESALKDLDKTGTVGIAAIAHKKVDHYQNRHWITREHPFVDRMASAWLIKRFIDPQATFEFIEERQVSAAAPRAVTFDIRGGEFTHHGDLCTFEVLVKAFGIKDKTVRKIAEIVHDLDVKDDKYNNAGTTGVEEILSGIRKTGKDDTDMLERGMAVFEMLYQAKT